MKDNEIDYHSTGYHDAIDDIRITLKRSGIASLPEVKDAASSDNRCLPFDLRMLERIMPDIYKDD